MWVLESVSQTLHKCLVQSLIFENPILVRWPLKMHTHHVCVDESCDTKFPIHVGDMHRLTIWDKGHRLAEESSPSIVWQSRDIQNVVIYREDTLRVCCCLLIISNTLPLVTNTSANYQHLNSTVSQRQTRYIAEESPDEAMVH